MPAILIAEDERRIASILHKGLSNNGFAVRVVSDGSSAYAGARSGGFDVMVLDIGLPGIDGLPGTDGVTLLRRLRVEGSSLPVLVLTDRATGADTIAALRDSADDYLPKPFRFEDLLTRVRQRLAPVPASRTAVASELTYGDLRLERSTRTAHVGDYCVELSAREFALAETFMRHPGQVLSREQLLASVWGHECEPGSNVVDVYVRYLRRKLGANRFVTLRGMGYRLEAAH